MTLLITSFIAGILTILAPCILPLLPVTLGGAVAGSDNKRRPLIIIGSLSLSVLVFTLLLKGSTALISTSPEFWSYISAVILFVFGLTLLFPITWAKIMLTLPGHNAPESWMAKGYQNRGHFWADVLLGAALGPVFTTCSPTFFLIIATVLPQSLSMGIIDLLAYIIGLALSLLLVAYVGQKFVNRLEWATDPNGWFRKTLGVLFIILAICIATGYDKIIEAKILNSGFFDVTKLEQSIKESLDGMGDAPIQYYQYGSSTTTNAACSPGQVCPVATSSKPTTALHPQNNYPAYIPGEKNGGRYTEIVNPAGFVNSDPFKLSDFIGKKVILVDFIDYSCINCERTFPYLENWYTTYKDQGLEIVAIHTPEFSFEKQKSNVEAAAKQFGLTFPIVLDNDYSTWNAYKNQYWPHKYIIDIHGNVVYDHIGEGQYDLTEQEIMKQLKIRLQATGEAGVVTQSTTTIPQYTIQAESPETYFGASRNEYFGNGVPGRIITSTYTIPKTLDVNQFYLGGSWHIDQEYAESTGNTSQISYTFTAKNVYIVAESKDGTAIEGSILIDGASIPSTMSGTDVMNGVVSISSSRLYRLYSNPTLGRHRIDIIFAKPGVRVYTFTFG